MKIVIGISTGQRADQAVSVSMAWRNKGILPVILTWDVLTEEVFKTSLGGRVDFVTNERKPFGVNQNYMMKNTPDWDVWICGADDLWPGKQDDLRDRIELVAEEAGDRLIWVKDGCLNAQPTQPIITRTMWEAERGNIFCEEYKHNYTDTDLFARMLLQKRVVKCYDIEFDHRHPRTGKSKEDEIYKIGDESFAEDSIIFHKKFTGQNISTIDNVEEVFIDEEQAA